MTVEEIEIRVTASVEEALREFKKMLPEIKKQMGQVQQEFSKVDMKSIASKTQNAVQQVKQKIGELKGSNTDKALQMQFERASTSVMNYRKQLEQTKEQLRQVYAQMDVKQEKTWKQYTPDGIELGNKGIEPAINKVLGADKEYQSLINQETKLNQKVQELNQKLQQAKQNYKNIGAEVEQTQTKQNMFTNMAGKVNNVLQTIKSKAGSVSSVFNKLPSITAKINANIKQMSTGMKQGLGHILKYAGALFSLRGIYSILSSSASSWLNSQNAGTQQLKTNIEYMKNAMGSALAPVIQWITNLIYNLMKAIQSVVYALFRVNIFAKASAKSYASMAGNAKKAKNETKSLASVHDEINNVSKNDNADSGGNGSGAGTPSFDLSGIDNQMSPLAQKLHDFFKPLKESWDVYGPALIEQIKTTASQIGYLLSSVWGSFEKAITNGTVYTTLELILAIIGNIAKAFANAWNYHGNGDAIIQNLANALNNLLTAINNFVTSDKFQEWLNKCSDKLKLMSDKIAEIDWQPVIDTIGDIGMALGMLALDILDKLIDAFKWLTEHPDVATILVAIGIALAVIGTVISIVSTVMAILTPIATALNVAMLPLIATIAGIIAIIVVLIIMFIEIKKQIEILKENWDILWPAMKEKIINVFNEIKEKAKEFKDKLVEKFTEIKDTVVNKVTELKDKAIDKFENIKNTISEKVNTIKTNLSNTLNNIKTNWDNIMNGLRTTVSNVWNGIWRYN